MGLLSGIARLGRRGLGREGREMLASGEMFGRMPQPRFQRMTDEALDAAGYKPTPVYGSPQAQGMGGYGPRANPTTQMSEMQAMRNKLRQLQQERTQATSPEELQEIDMEISWLMRDLGM